MQGIYQIRNKANGKIYIGSSCHIKERWEQHQSALSGNWHHNKYLQRSYNKYGKECLEYLVLEIVKDESALIRKEQYYYDKLNPDYNIGEFADNGFRGMQHTKDTKKRISNSLKGRMLSEEHKAKIGLSRRGKKHPLWGKTHTKKSRKKMSISRRGEKNHLSKLTATKVKEARNIWDSGKYTYKEIIELLNIDVSVQTVAQAVYGKTWKHAGGPIAKSSFLSCEKVETIRNMAKNGISYEDIIFRLNIDKAKNTISTIVNGRSHKNCPGPIKGNDY